MAVTTPTRSTPYGIRAAPRPAWHTAPKAPRFSGRVYADGTVRPSPLTLEERVEAMRMLADYSISKAPIRRDETEYLFRELQSAAMLSLYVDFKKFKSMNGPGSPEKSRKMGYETAQKLFSELPQNSRIPYESLEKMAQHIYDAIGNTVNGVPKSFRVAYRDGFTRAFFDGIKALGGANAFSHSSKRRG